VEDGNRQFAAGKLADAELLYRKAIQKDGTHGDAHYRLGLVFLRQNKGVEAFQLFTRAVELQPTHRDALQNLGDIALAVYMADTRRPQHMYDTLKRAAKSLMDQEPASYDANRLAGFLALIDSQPSEAVRLFRQADQAKPGQPELRLTLAQALIQAGDAAEGEALALKVADSNPEFDEAYMMLFRRFVSDRRPSDAEAILKRRIDNNPTRADHVVSLAAYYSATNQKAKADELLAKVTSDSTLYPDGTLAAGDYEVRSGNYEAALSYYARGMNSPGPSQLTSRKRYVGALVLAGRRSEASGLLEQLAKEAPDDRDVRASRAYLLLESGTAEGTKQAMDQIRELIKEKDDQSALHFHLGRGLLAQGDTEGARKEWLRAVQLDAVDIRPRLGLARLSLNTGDASSALRQAEELLQIYIGNPELELIRAGALQASGRFPEARSALDGLRKRFPGNPAVESESAFLALADRKPLEAERGFRKLYRPGDPNLRILVGLTQALLQAGKRGDALRLLEDDLKAVPNRSAVQVMLAEGYAASGEPEKAAGLLEAVIQAEPGTTSAYGVLAGIRLRENRLGDAIQLLTTATEKSPGNADLLASLGEVQHAENRLDEAERSLRAALAADSGSRRARIGLALVLADAGSKLDEALQSAQAALTRMPSDLLARDALAYVYLKQKRTDVALTSFRGVTSQNPNVPLFRYHYGLALAESGETAKARAEFEAALAQNPPPFLEKRIRAALR